MDRMARMVANMAFWLAQRFQPHQFDVLPPALPIAIKFSQLSKNSENRSKMLIFGIRELNLDWTTSTRLSTSTTFQF